MGGVEPRVLLRPWWVDKELAWGGDKGPPDSLTVRETPLLLLKSPDRHITEAYSLVLAASQHGSAEIKSSGGLCFLLPFQCTCFSWVLEPLIPGAPGSCCMPVSLGVGYLSELRTNRSP